MSWWTDILVYRYTGGQKSFCSVVLAAQMSWYNLNQGWGTRASIYYIYMGHIHGKQYFSLTKGAKSLSKQALCTFWYVSLQIYSTASKFMQKLGLETFSLFSGSTVKNPNFSEFYIISLIIENAQVDFKSEIPPQQKLRSSWNFIW